MYTGEEQEILLEAADILLERNAYFDRYKDSRLDKFIDPDKPKKAKDVKKNDWLWYVNLETSEIELGRVSDVQKDYWTHEDRFHSSPYIVVYFYKDRQWTVYEDIEQLVPYEGNKNPYNLALKKAQQGDHEDLERLISNTPSTKKRAYADATRTKDTFKKDTIIEAKRKSSVLKWIAYFTDIRDGKITPMNVIDQYNIRDHPPSYKSTFRRNLEQYLIEEGIEKIKIGDEYYKAWRVLYRMIPTYGKEDDINRAFAPIFIDFANESLASLEADLEEIEQDKKIKYVR